MESAEKHASLSVEEARAQLPEGARVGVVHDWLNGMRGGEKVLEVILELFPGASIYTLFLDRSRLSDTILAHPITASRLNDLPKSGRFYRHMLPLMPRVMDAGPKFPDGSIDLMISTSHCVAKGAIPPKGTNGKPVPHICYCHAPMRYVWDQFDEYFGPGKASPAVRATMKAVQRPLQKWDQKTAARVDAFIANGQNIAGKIKRFYNREASVVHPPVDTERFQPLESLDEIENAWLVVSALVPYKRVDLAVEAAIKRGEKLYLLGRGPEQEKLESLAAKNSNLIDIRGWVSDEDLARFYARCKGLIFPGEEDFGITPLEAMASGRPVIAYAKGGALETVVEGETGVFFHEQTTEAVAEAMARASEIEWDSEKIRDHAMKFSREACKLEMARQFAGYYMKITTEKQRSRE